MKPPNQSQNFSTSSLTQKEEPNYSGYANSKVYKPIQEVSEVGSEEDDEAIMISAKGKIMKNRLSKGSKHHQSHKQFSTSKEP